MKLKKLEIERAVWGDHRGKYVGKVSFDGPQGDIGIVMSPELTESFLSLAGDLLIAHVEVAGKELQTSIDEAVDRARLNNRVPEEIARVFGRQIEMISEGES